VSLRGRAGGVRVLFNHSHSYWGYYTLNSQTFGTCRVKVVVVLRHHKGHKRKHGRRWLAYAVSRLPHRTDPRPIFQWYRRPFGIETTYRLMNRVRARTTSRSPVLRRLLVGLTLVLANLYVALRQACSLLVETLAEPETPATRVAFWLDRLVELGRHTIEADLGGHPALLFRQPITFS
jgi:IS4 transposase